MVQQRERQVQATLHAARVATHLAVGGLGQPDAREQLGAAGFTLALGQAMQGALQAHVLAAGEERVERGLLQRGADRAPDIGALADDVEARHAGAAGGRRQQRREHQHGRRLAGSVGAEEAIDLTGRHAQVDAVHGSHVALEDADERLDFDAVVGLLHRHDVIASRRQTPGRPQNPPPELPLVEIPRAGGKSSPGPEPYREQVMPDGRVRHGERLRLNKQETRRVVKPENW